MLETITVLDILNRLERKVQIIKGAIENKNVDRLRDECVCSLICGDETILTEVPVLDDNLCFSYKGFNCELSSCNFTDRYVCWIYGHKDSDGKTFSEYLKNNPVLNETWAPEIYLVPKAWAWGASSDLKPGHAVSKIILEGIDEFLEQHKSI